MLCCRGGDFAKRGATKERCQRACGLVLVFMVVMLHGFSGGEQRCGEMLSESFARSLGLWAVSDKVLSAPAPVACHDVALLISGVGLPAKTLTCSSASLRTFFPCP